MVNQGVWMGKDYIVTDCIENSERNRCVDIIRQQDGKYRFQEWRRDSEDTTGWILLLDSQPVVFDSEAGAMSAAQLRCIWLKAQSNPETFRVAGS